ncbi:MAG: serine/threonine-protein kinase, partial [Chloroflexota bacterium]
MIGAYQIVAPLGQGGTATVYRAFHARLNRHVAIKMIHQAYLDDPNFLTRFEREAKIIAALEHPHIVPVYDFSEHAGEPYLVMKLIEGSTLKALMAKKPLSNGEILRLATPVAAALDYAHRRGVLHRDIKPSNIMLDGVSTPYLTDFGLARVAAAGDSTISQDMLLGTPHYISPEQARGKGEVDYRSDLYSFGVVLYELLTGQVPFSGGTPYSIINDHIYQPLPLPSSFNPEISPPVEAVLLQALRKDPADRFQSAAELVQALSNAFDGYPPVVNESDTQPLTFPPPPKPPVKPAPRPVRQPRRKFWLWAGWVLATGAAGAMVAVLVSVLINPNRLNSTPPPPPPGVTLYDVPILSLGDASAQVSAHPTDPIAYLALARAQLSADDMPGVRRSIAQGLDAGSEDVRFELT